MFAILLYDIELFFGLWDGLSILFMNILLANSTHLTLQKLHDIYQKHKRPNSIYW